MTELNTLLNNVLPLVQTNLTRLEITELLLSAPKYRGVQIKQMTVPISGSYGGMRALADEAFSRWILIQTQKRSENLFTMLNPNNAYCYALLF